MRSVAVATAVVALVGCHGAARIPEESAMTRTVETGFVGKTISIGGGEYRYAVYMPENYDPARPWPAILFLHGIGERGDDGMSHVGVGLGKAIREHPERFPCVVVMPQCQPQMAWTGPMYDLALRTLDAACAEYNIDEDRVVLTGLSMGGFGAWLIGAEHANRFSALVPICGGGNPAHAAKLAAVPIWCFHGEADPVIPVRRSREMVDAVRAAGGRVTYTELPGVGHNSWDPAYGDARLITWMLSQRRSK
jgi:predicted peptidase